jgi:hypothetical protein
MAEKTERKPTRPRKRPWQRPRVKAGQLFESNSLACAKSPTMPNEMCLQVGFSTS